MTEQFWIAILNLVAKIGLQSTIELLSATPKTLDDAIAALRRAQNLTLEQIIAEEKARETPPPAS